MTNEHTNLPALVAGLRSARASVHDAIGEAGHAWQEAARVPDGGESWTVGQIAEHVVENDYFFANHLARACGWDELGTPPHEFVVADEALAALHVGAAAAAPMLDRLTEVDLAREWLHEMSVADLLGAYAGHFEDHAAQVRAIVAALAPA